MYLEKIKLINFRCYKEFECNFKPGLNVIVGDNAVGKTTLAEAVYILCIGRSFRTNKIVESINFDEQYCSLKGTIKYPQKTSEILVSFDQKNKVLKINQNKVEKLSDFIGQNRAIIFGLEDIMIINGSPSYSRKFLNFNLGQLDKDYIDVLNKYQKLLKTRNELLKSFDETNVNQKNLFDVVTKDLSVQAEILIQKRKKFIDEINIYFERNVKTISGGKECGKVVYKPKVLVDKVLKTFTSRYEFDKFHQTTTAGPHRDDLDFVINGLDASSFASQGQQRTFALALKLSVVDILKKHGYDFIVILDDVLGELDSSRQQIIMKNIGSDNQVLITTTTMNIDGDYNIINIKRKEE